MEEAKVVESKDGTISVASAFAGHQEGNIVVSSSSILSTLCSLFPAAWHGTQNE
jgi:hypothetical protein